MRHTFGVIALLAGICAANVNTCLGTELDLRNPAFMPPGEETTIPVGAYAFCKTYAGECRAVTNTETHADLTEGTWMQLLVTNNDLNRAIQPITDLDQYGQTEYWTYPVKSGDCEDYVLAKRRTLMEAGWPTGALMVAVVRQRNGEGHAVLVVRTDRGDLVLDNLRPEISLWSDTPYVFVKRQSETLARWVSVG